MLLKTTKFIQSHLKYYYKIFFRVIENLLKATQTLLKNELELVKYFSKFKVSQNCYKIGHTCSKLDLCCLKCDESYSKFTQSNPKFTLYHSFTQISLSFQNNLEPFILCFQFSQSCSQENPWILFKSQEIHSSIFCYKIERARSVFSPPSYTPFP